MTIRNTLLVAVAIMVAGCGPASPADTFRADPEAMKRGKSLFVGTCAGYCHNTVADNRDAPYLFDRQWLHGGADREIFDSIANGIPGTTMIGFKGKLPQGDDDIWRLVAYITTAATTE
ncbi:MAG: c-type cytochrome [Gammaproteobacteria bacterium]|nr:c-type cytochrome [Gammaproteobacteria bacterium]